MRMGGLLRFVLPVGAFVAVGWGATSAAALPEPDDLVPNTVARISEVPDRTGTITKAELRHALVLAAIQEDRHPVPRPDGRGYARLAHIAVNRLLEAIWIKGQAAEMGIFVTPSQVSRQLTLIKEQNFEDEAEYRAFLRETRYTRRDIFGQVELQLLGIRIQRRIAARVRSKSEEDEVFNEFVSAFNERWRSRTVCAPAYVTSRCSNGPA